MSYMINQFAKVAHYSRLANLANILHDQRIKLSRVSDLDDPRESSFSWIEYAGIGHEVDAEGMTLVSKAIANIGSSLRMFCSVSSCMNIESLSSCPVESAIYGRPRMWSQYGDNSRGFCVILNKDIITASIAKAAKNPQHLVYGKVDYINWLHLVESRVYIEHSPAIAAQSFDAFGIVSSNKMLESVYFKKSLDWRDENEFRWLLYTESTEDIFISITGAVEAVVLGCKFPENQISQVVDYCRKLSCSCYRLNYTHPTYEVILVWNRSVENS